LGINSSNSPTDGLYVNGQTLIGVSNGTGGTLYQQGAKLQVQTNLKYAGYFSTDSLSPTSYAVYAKHTGTGTSDTRAMKGEAVSAPGYGYGGDFRGGYRGIYGLADATTYSGTAYGVYGYAFGSTGTRYGVYGYASGGTTNYGIYCDGNGAYTGTWTDVSDQKFKKDVADYTGALDNVLKLKPVVYTMRAEEYPNMGFESGREIGFIAQEMEKVFPTLVVNGVHPGATKEDAEITYKGINYIGLIPVLVKAMQEQQAEIESLKLEIKSLKGN
ncbi:MAG: tail fiber domain-containing protein, partial [Bacteroidales bacterium]